VTKNNISLFFLLLSFSFLASPILGRAQGRHPPPQSGDETAVPPGTDEMRDRLAHDMAKKANLQRQVALKNDTERLVKLSDELKDYVDKSNENVLSLDVMKKAEEIEKLARSVKEKMKGLN
jgi:hypothetical protein